MDRQDLRRLSACPEHYRFFRMLRADGISATRCIKAPSLPLSSGTGCSATAPHFRHQSLVHQDRRGSLRYCHQRYRGHLISLVIACWGTLWVSNRRSMGGWEFKVGTRFFTSPSLQH